MINEPPHHSEPETGDPRPISRQRLSLLTRRPALVPITLWLSVFLIHSFSPTPQSGDSRLSTITAWQFFHHLNLNLEDYSVVQSLQYQADIVIVDGHWLPFFPWPTMLLAAPVA